MKDSYGRTIDYLRISLTDRCNLRCRYCMPGEGVKKFRHRDILRFEEIRRVLRICRELDITKFRFTGGEPFLRKGVLDFFEGLPAGDYHITTNLAIADLEMERINRLKIAGLNVSCDSLRPERYRHITRWGELPVFLENLKRIRVDNLKINVVVIKDFNEDEIVDFIRFAGEHRATVRFIEKMDFASGGPEFSSLSGIREQLIREGIIEPEGYRIHNSVSEYHSLTGQGGRVGFITPITRHFCGTCSKIRLKANGELKLCVFEKSDFNLRDILRANPDDETVKRWLTEVIQHKSLEPAIKKNLETMAEIGG
ncbi:MAG: radical SAM protein [PVC group bacterium]